MIKNKSNLTILRIVSFVFKDIVMINQNFIKALKKINKEFQKHKIRWVLVGSLSLAFQNVKIKPNDIDILTDKEGALKSNKIFKRYIEKAVKWSQTERYDSFFGKFQINDVAVEIMGDLKVKEGNKWIELKPRLEKPHFIRLEDILIPVTPLEDQLKSYKKSTNNKDRKKLRFIEETLNL